MGLKAEDRFLLFWSILGAVGFITIWHLPWRFQVNDDTIMMWLTSGAYSGKPEDFAVFIHPLLSWTFAKLYSLFPQINWYPVTWFLVMYFSFVAFLLSIWRNISNKLLNHFFSLFLFAFAIHFLFFLQFSIVAAFALASGLTSRALKFNGKLDSRLTGAENISSFSFYKSDLLIFLGALIRLEALLLFLAGITVLGLMAYKKTFRPKFLVSPGILFLFLFLFNQAWIRGNGLQDFNQANKLRSSVFDDPVLQLRKEAFRKTTPDLYYFANGLMDFGRETDLVLKMEIWKKQLNQERFAAISPSYLFKALTYLIWNERYFSFLFLVLLSLSFFLQLKKSIISVGVLLAIMILLSPFFLLKIQVYVIILLVYLSTLIMFGKEKIYNPRILVPALLVLPVLIIIHLYSLFIHEKKSFPKEEFENFGNFESSNGKFQNLYLIGFDQLDYDFSLNKPNKIKFLGWPTLLLNHQEEHAIYKVKREVYEENMGYFKSFQVLNEYPGYLDLIFLK